MAGGPGLNTPLIDRVLASANGPETSNLKHQQRDADKEPPYVVEIEALVRRLRSRMGILHGIARVNGQVVVEGTMTFALGPRIEAVSS